MADSNNAQQQPRSARMPEPEHFSTPWEEERELTPEELDDMRRRHPRAAYIIPHLPKD